MSGTELYPAASATLIIWGTDFDPQEVTLSLDWQPSQSWQRGERKSFIRADGSIHLFDSYHEWSGWKLWLDDDWRHRPLIEQIGHWAMDRLPGSAEVLLGWRERGACIELNCCAVASSSVHLQFPSAWLVQLGNMGVDIDLTFYPYSE